MRRAVACIAALVAAWGGVAGSPAEFRWAVAVLPSGEEFALEVAATPAARAVGYMGRERVGSREGMLFVFEESGRHGIWMKNCRVSLDVVWLDDRFRVVQVAADQVPCTDGESCPVVEPLRTARYVLEFAAGTARAHRLATGSFVTILSDPELR